MKLIADSTVLIHLWRHRKHQDRIVPLRERLIGHEPLLPWMVLYEFARGHFHRGRTEAEMMDFLARFTLLPTTQAQVLRAARIASELQSKGITPGTGDAWIAAAALEADLPVLTHNVDHFNQVPGVQVISYTILP